MAEYRVLLMIVGVDKFFVIYSLEEHNIEDMSDDEYTCDAYVAIHVIVPYGELSRWYALEDLQLLKDTAVKAILLQEQADENTTVIETEPMAAGVH